MILDEYALVPDIFDPNSYSAPNLAGVYLTHIRRSLMEEAVVSDLRAGEWLKSVIANLGTYDVKAKNLLTDLRKNSRIVFRSAVGGGPCTNGLEWCKEGLAAHALERLTGVVAAENLQPQLKYLTGPIESIDRLNLAAWWRPGACTINSERTIAAYLEVLYPVLRYANSAMFIDPHFDPAEARYTEFPKVLVPMAGRQPVPTIEIHRVVSHGAGRERTPRAPEFWQGRFESLSVRLRKMGLKAKVVLWDNFHDRFLITNHVGISLTNGFDTTTDPAATVVWSRMNRATADEKQREFDLASAFHRCQYCFEIGQ